MITTDQKEVLLNGISQHIKDRRIKSLLDIGAGDGVLAKKLAGEVSQYLAIESNSNYVQKLENLGLEVVNSTFPITVDRKFDMVLASHSIPEDEKLHKPFLKNAWDLVNSTGVLLIVTFKGGKGELVDLRKKWGNNENNEEGKIFDEKLYSVMLEILKTFGSINDHYRATSKFESENINETVDLVLSSVNPKPDARDACREDIKEIIRTKYFSDGKYFFSYEHVFVSCSRISFGSKS